MRYKVIDVGFFDPEKEELINLLDGGWEIVTAT